MGLLPIMYGMFVNTKNMKNIYAMKTGMLLEK